jgi:hypothetical protein
VESRMTIVGESEQHNDVDAALLQGRDARQHGLRVAASILRRDEPRRPNAITCSCFAFSKTLPMPTEANFPRRR